MDDEECRRDMPDAPDDSLKDVAMDNEECRKARAAERLMGMGREEMEEADLLDMPAEKLLRLLYLSQLLPDSPEKEGG